MAITGRTPTLVENSSTQTITGSLPSDRQAGDLCLAFFAMDATSGWTAPSGWTQVLAPTATSTSTESMAVYYRFDPPTGPTLSHTEAAARATAIVQAYGGVHPSTPIDVSAASATATGSSVNAPSVTTVTNAAMLISSYVVDTSSRAPVTPSGMTGVQAYSEASNGRFLAVAQELRATAGSTGTRTWSYTPASTLGQVAASFALRPGSVMTVTGSVSASGVLTKRANKNPFTASVTATGALTALKVVTRVFTASVTATGAFAKRTIKVLTGSIASSGVARKVIYRSPMTGSIAATGAYSKAFVRIVTGSITATSSFTITLLGRVFGRPGIISTVASKAGEVVMRIRRT